MSDLRISIGDYMNPKYQHNCDLCKFLGRYKKYDLYVCVRNNIADTVIARHGSNGPDYSSGLIFAHRNLIPELVEAKNRAEALGIDCSKNS